MTEGKKGNTNEKEDEKKGSNQDTQSDRHLVFDFAGPW